MSCSEARSLTIGTARRKKDEKKKRRKQEAVAVGSSGEGALEGEREVNFIKWWLVTLVGCGLWRGLPGRGRGGEEKRGESEAQARAQAQARPREVQIKKKSQLKISAANGPSASPQQEIKLATHRLWSGAGGWPWLQDTVVVVVRVGEAAGRFCGATLLCSAVSGWMCGNRRHRIGCRTGAVRMHARTDDQAGWLARQRSKIKNVAFDCRNSFP